MRLDTETYWLTDRQSQCDFDLTWCTPISGLESRDLWIFIVPPGLAISIARESTGHLGTEERSTVQECGQKRTLLLHFMRSQLTLTHFVSLQSERVKFKRIRCFIKADVIGVPVLVSSEFNDLTSLNTGNLFRTCNIYDFFFNKCP
jgi:hypothetical protein